jgi:ankyrin repeat protein
MCFKKSISGIDSLIETKANSLTKFRQQIDSIIESNNLIELKRLSEKGCDLHKDEYALRTAVKFGNLELVKYLVEECKADIHYENDVVLQIAYDNHRCEIIKYLIANGIDIHSRGEIALLDACKHNEYDLVVALLPKEKFGEGLKASCWNGHYELTKYFVDNGVDMDNFDAIQGAILMSNIEIITLFIDAKVDFKKYEHKFNLLGLPYYNLSPLMFKTISEKSLFSDDWFVNEYAFNNRSDWKNSSNLLTQYMMSLSRGKICEISRKRGYCIHNVYKYNRESSPQPLWKCAFCCHYESE